MFIDVCTCIVEVGLSECCFWHSPDFTSFNRRSKSSSIRPTNPSTHTPSNMITPPYNKVGRSEAPLEVLHAITRCPLDRPVQQQSLWAIHYCCLHDATQRRLLTGGGGLPSSPSSEQQQQQQRGKVEKKVANPLIRVLAVLLVVRPHEIATAKAEQSQAEALQELAGVASTANVRQRDVVNTAASGTSQKSDKSGGADKHKKKRTVRKMQHQINNTACIFILIPFSIWYDFLWTIKKLTFMLYLLLCLDIVIHNDIFHIPLPFSPLISRQKSSCAIPFPETWCSRLKCTLTPPLRYAYVFG